MRFVAKFPHDSLELWGFFVPLHKKETMVITRYYTNDESLNKCDEPYRSVVELLDQLKNETPDGCENMSFPSFTLCHIVSAVRTVYEKLRNNLLIFNSTLIKIRSAMTSTRNSIDYDNFYLTIPSSQALLFGAVYYVAAHDSTFKDKQLEAIAKFSCQNKPSTAIFQYFKEPADQKRKELIANNPSEQVENHVLPAAKVEPSKVTALTNVIEELECQLAEQKADYQGQQNEIAALAAQHQTIDTEIDKDERDHEEAFYNKVCFEFFIRLMERAGLDLNNTGNKSRIGALWHKITGKSADDLRRYCSKRNYQNNHTREDIKALNELLSDMKFEMQL